MTTMTPQDDVQGYVEPLTIMTVAVVIAAGAQFGIGFSDVIGKDVFAAARGYAKPAK